MRISLIVLTVITFNVTPLVAQSGRKTRSDAAVAEHANKDAAAVGAVAAQSEDTTAGGLQLNGGNLFLAVRVSASTDSGIRSAPAGSKVRVVRQEAGGIRVADPSGNEFVVSSKQLTNDNAAAKSLEAKENAARAGIGNAFGAAPIAQVAPPVSEADAAREKVMNAANARVEERAANSSTPPRPFTPSSTLDRPVEASSSKSHVRNKKNTNAQRTTKPANKKTK